MKQTIYYPAYTSENLEKYRRLLPPKRHIDQPLVYMEMAYNGADYTTELRLDAHDERQYMVPYESRTVKTVALNSMGLHSHDFYEMFVVAEGELDIRTGSDVRAFRTGEVCILNKNVSHVELFRPNAKLIYLGMTDAFFVELTKAAQKHTFVPGSLIASFFERSLSGGDALKSEYLSFVPEGDAPVAALMQDVAKRLRSRRISAPSYIFADVLEIFELLSSPELYTGRCVELVEYPIESIAAIICRMIDESGGDISVQELARRLNYDPTYISRILKKYTGHSPKEYCQLCRMNLLRKRILSSDESISSILKQLGYENKTQVYRVFKRIYGCTPNDYRKRSPEADREPVSEDLNVVFRNRTL